MKVGTYPDNAHTENCKDIYKFRNNDKLRSHET